MVPASEGATTLDTSSRGPSSSEGEAFLEPAGDWKTGTRAARVAAFPARAPERDRPPSFFPCAHPDRTCRLHATTLARRRCRRRVRRCPCSSPRGLLVRSAFFEGAALRETSSRPGLSLALPRVPVVARPAACPLSCSSAVALAQPRSSASSLKSTPRGTVRGRSDEPALQDKDLASRRTDGRASASDHKDVACLAKNARKERKSDAVGASAGRPERSPTHPLSPRARSQRTHRSHEATLTSCELLSRCSTSLCCCSASPRCGTCCSPGRRAGRASSCRTAFLFPLALFEVRADLDSSHAVLQS